jgi:FemAB-related protein (PEP-CTERM system-associated)
MANFWENTLPVWMPEALKSLNYKPLQPNRADFAGHRLALDLPSTLLKSRMNVPVCSGVTAREKQSEHPVINLLPEEDGGRWDDFVFSHPHGTPFHLTAWKRSIEETFRYRSYYVMAQDQSGRIRGVLPLFLVRNLFLHKLLISSPFAVYGGILADSAEVRTELRNYAVELGTELSVHNIELRNAYSEQCTGAPNVHRYVTFTQEVGPDEDRLLESIPRKTRYMVRKSLKEDYACVRQDHDFRAFEDLYSRSLRKLGTPSFPKKHFARILANFKGMVDIREYTLRGQVVSAVLTFYFRDQVLPYYGASDPAFNAQAPNNYMYFDLMRWAGKNGYQTYDFGRSKKLGSGSYDFKAHWGMVERELPYEILLMKGSTLPNCSPTNSRLQGLIKVWQHLPLNVTRAIGPYFLRLVP